MNLNPFYKGRGGGGIIIPESKFWEIYLELDFFL